MIKKLYLLPVILFALSFTACNETEDPGIYVNWQERNEAFIDSLQRVVDSNNDPTLKQLVYSRDKSLSLYYKIIESGPKVTPDNKPIDPAYWTSKVDVFYRGILINEEVFSKAESPYYYTELYADDDLLVFDQNFTEGKPTNLDSPTNFTVNTGIIVGWTEILQLMRPGDRFEVYIPHQLAYDSAGKGTVPGYSTLIFDMIMVNIDYYPK